MGMQISRTLNYIVPHVTRESKVLDVGSGRGEIALRIARKTGCTVYGIDSSGWAVDRARARSREGGLQDRLIFLRQRAEDLDFPSGYFDLVYSVKVLHETRYTEALREMYRVLKNVDGQLILVDWAKGTKTWTFERYFSLDELEKMVREIGFITTESVQRKDVIYLHARKLKNLDFVHR